MVIFAFIETIINFHNHYYSEFESFLLRGEDKERYRLKKSIILYHNYLSILFFAIIPFVNPVASSLKSTFQIIVALGQICTLHEKNYVMIGSYSYISALCSIFCHYYTESEPLTLFGLVLANHHIFFLFPESQILSKVYLPVTFSFVYFMQRRFVQNWDFWDEKIERSIKSFNYSWSLILLLHYLGARNLTSSYRLTLIHNMEIQDHLKNTFELLEKTNINLTDALKARELFIASVSHELRNPLNCLIGNIELLRLEAKDEKSQNSLDTCKKSCDILLGLINNILDVAKINAETLELHYQAEHFRRVVEKVWSTCEDSIKQKKLQGELYIESDFPKYVEIDSHRITQILLNLVGNAIKFCDRGFVNVVITWHPGGFTNNLRKPSHSFQSESHLKTDFSLSPGKKEIDVGSYEFENTEKRSVNMQEILGRQLTLKPLRKISSSGVSSIPDQTLCQSSIGRISSNPLDNSSSITKGFIKIQVVDSGCGMSPEILNKLFQPFSQADSSITRKFGGAGLGLYVTKEIIQKMGGEIHVESKEEGGSTFVVLIPAQTAQKEELGLIPASQTNILETNQPTKALVVDDITTNQLILSSYLEKLNIQSDIANNGSEALEMFKAKPNGYYSFITMDLQMPVMDGITVCQEIRKYETTKDLSPVPIIVITGNCAETEKMKCLDPNGGVRAMNFFRKPFSFEKCKEVIQSIFNENKRTRPS